MDINQSHVAKETGAISMSESEVKFDESVLEFINSEWKEYEEELYHDAISGELMIKELVGAASKVEMETYKKNGVYEIVPLEECWKETGNACVGVRWVDTNKGDKEKPEYGCRVVAKEIKKDKHEDLFAATPPLKAKRSLFSLWASVPGMCLDFGDVVRAYSLERAGKSTWSYRRGTTRRASADCGESHVWLL
jgi:hypothetical protein